MKQNRITVIAAVFVVIILSASAMDYCTGYLGMTSAQVDRLIDIIVA